MTDVGRIERGERDPAVSPVAPFAAGGGARYEWQRAVEDGLCERRPGLTPGSRLAAGGGGMAEQNVNVTQVVQNQGCMSGCFTLFAVLAVIGLAVEYWYVSVGVLVVAAVGGYFYWRHQQELAAAAPAPPLHAQSTVGAAIVSPEETAAFAKTCASCGMTGLSGKFCPECGAAQTKTCAGCGMSGLASAFCPECGSATYWPPVPS